MDAKDRAVRERMIRSASARQVEAIEQRAERLRALATELDQLAKRAAKVGTAEFDGIEQTNSQAWFAGQAIHAISWAFANLNLSQLVDGAADVDRQRTELFFLGSMP